MHLEGIHVWILSDLLGVAVPAAVMVAVVMSFRRRQHSVPHGVIGRAKVVSVETLNRVADSPQGFCTMNLVVSGPGIQPTAVLYQHTIFTHTWPKPGMELPCMFDPRKVDGVVIDWSALPDPAELARQQAYVLQQEMRGLPVGLTTSSTRLPSTAENFVSSLEQLADLRDRGEITAADYSLQKRHLLDSSSVES